MSPGPTTPAARTPAVDAGRRGRLVLAERVVEKIAAQAAAEAVRVRRRGAGRPEVDADLGLDSVDLSLSVEIPYPGSVRQAVDRVRSHVRDRVAELTGVPVRRVDVDVVRLSPATPSSSSREVLR